MSEGPEDYQDSTDGPEDEFRAKYDANGCPSKRINDFKVKSFLARGVFAEVYKAELDGKSYAIRMHWKYAALQNALYKDIRKGNRILYAMDSLYVVKLHFKCKDKHKVYSVLEYTPYGDLGNLLQVYPDERLEEEKGRKVLFQVVQGLEYIHACKVIHRDLTPANILIFPGGRVKISDFDCAVFWADEPRGNVGTISYNAPEMDNEQQPYGAGVDWWSFGILMCKVLIGRRYHPFFTKKSRSEKLRQLRERELDDNLGGDKLSDEAKDLIKQLLEREVTKRLSTVFEITQHAWFRSIELEDITKEDPEVNFPWEKLKNEGSLKIDKNEFRRAEPDDDTEFHGVYADF